MSYQYSENSYIMPTEVQAIIAAVPKVSRHPERDTLLIETAWETAGRIMEVLTLVPEHVLERSIVLDNLKQRHKDGKVPQKIVVVSPDLCTWIKDYCERNKILKGEWVFFAARTKARHMNTNVADEMLTKASEAAGVYRLGKRNPRTGGRYKGVSFHVLRHSYATYLLRQGNNLGSVQKQLGHSQQASTNKYAAIVFDDVAATVEKAKVNLYHP